MPQLFTDESLNDSIRQKIYLDMKFLMNERVDLLTICEAD